MYNTKTKIKILHIAECAGGVEKYLYTLLKFIDHRKFENIVLVSQNYDCTKIMDVAEHVVLLHMEHDICLTNLLVSFKVRKIIKKYSPNIIYAHSSIAGVIARLADLGIKNKCIYNPHGWSFNMDCPELRKKIYIFAERILAHFCDCIVCISINEKISALTQKICKKEKLSVILNGIDIQEQLNNLNSAKNPYNIPDNAYIVGTVGRITHQKAPDIFVKCAKQIKEWLPNAYFIMVGDGDERKKTEQLISALNLTKSFLITGWVDNTAQYVKFFDVAMLLSRWEGFGLVLPEYMIAGKPVVATNVDAIPSIIDDNKNGLLINVDDFGAASTAVKKIYEDEQLREKISKTANKDVYVKYNAQRMALEHEELFKKLVM